MPVDQIEQKSLEKNTKVAVLNARSIRSNHESIRDYICHENSDICVITETWIGDSDADAWYLKEVTPHGYEINVVNRDATTCRRGHP